MFSRYFLPHNLHHLGTSRHVIELESVVHTNILGLLKQQFRKRIGDQFLQITAPLLTILQLL